MSLRLKKDGSVDGRSTRKIETYHHIDLTGKAFGRLTAIERVGTNKRREVMWLCKCGCGNEHVVSSQKLLAGKSRSCGCLAQEVRVKANEKHGITTGGRPRTMTIWSGMKARCFNKKATSYKSYGARGITVCDEWLGENGFYNFHNWAIANGYSDDFEIDRIDNNGNYCPENCRWVPRSENRKHKRNTRHITVNGLTRNVSEWCAELKISRTTAYKYLNESDEKFAEYVKGQQYFIDKFLGKDGKTRLANADDEKLVTIKLFKDNGKYNEDARVFVDGTMYDVPRGVPVTVPQKVALALEAQAR